jgi:predicted methyltransferase
MNRKPLLLTLLPLALLLAGCASSGTRLEMSTALDQSLAAPDRPPADRDRDIWRHPRQTLLFFGLRPNMTVIELDPGTGWYTQVLAPVLRDRGRYIAALPPVSPQERGAVRERERLEAVIASRPQAFDRLQRAPFNPGVEPLAPDNSVDLVVTFRSLHNWMAEDKAAAAFADIFRALKPGGVLGIVEHRGNPQQPQDPKARSGYVNEATAMRLIESAGFRLVATSEINANPRDTKDHPRGVWNLPPTLIDGDKDRARYLAIGESDRFTFKFIKPR